MNTNNNTEEEVHLLLYDLTNGKATQYYKFLTGRDLEAIYHSSLVVYGKEYFFGGGICVGKPKCTPYGTPIKEINFGKTKKTEKEFDDYLESIDDKFNQSTYHLINNNCNHFTNAICNFLCDKPLPDNILKQHEVIMESALGKWLIPRLQAMSEKMTQAVPNSIENRNKDSNK